MCFFVAAMALGFARLLAAGPVSEDFEESLGGLREASRARLFSAGREMLLDLVVPKGEKSHSRSALAKSIDGLVPLA